MSNFRVESKIRLSDTDIAVLHQRIVQLESTVTRLAENDLQNTIDSKPLTEVIVRNSTNIEQLQKQMAQCSCGQF
ncbi:hypothetical protein MIV118R [Invertebrate iridescent virus 3]|uniref:Uncharacterized protein 118R n=1 Tax=Invertebrate iridescent virus 3 TaxID=345201 RepID=118R_IIV3|nr:hypothetical protein MIV118R [Invertebrate iridescent virus 3]Q196U2.1 RecName: Full=Uncharacterized protein 118R [Invertebrate iridescent virus 3]ABF82148.1 hypothetical protein MIV118R [Invertebrate iridescent virus 3]